MTILKIMIKKLYKKGYKLLKASGISPCKSKEPLKRLKNKGKTERDYSRYLVDMHSYSIKYAYKE